MEARGFPIRWYPSTGLQAVTQPRAPLSKLSPSTVFSVIQTTRLLCIADTFTIAGRINAELQQHWHYTFCTAWSLLGSPRNGQAALCVFQKLLACWEHTSSFSHWKFLKPLEKAWWRVRTISTSLPSLYRVNSHQVTWSLPYPHILTFVLPISG